MSKQAKVFLVPIPIAEGINGTLSSQVLDVTFGLKHYFVENIRTARRFLRSIHPTIVIDDIQFSEIDKHTGPELGLLRKWMKEGHVVGVMSESGCPGIADPGAELIAVAQQVGAEIIPLVGPNSLILALMASGLNGQSFCFNGYLPVKEPARSQRIKHLEQQSKKEIQTQLVIETPYRNNNLLEDFLKNCQNSTRLCIAQNITGPTASIKTRTIADWRKDKPTLEKVPVVFLFLA